MKRSLIAVAGLMLACSGTVASGAEGSQERDYRASEVCPADWTSGTALRERRLVVHAIDPFGMALPGAKVAVEQAAEKVAATDTDAAGHAVLEGLAVGNGRLRVEMPGFRSVDVTVRLRQGCVTAIIVPMEVGQLANTDPVPTRQRQP